LIYPEGYNERSVCRSSTTDVRFSVANLGTTHLNTQGIAVKASPDSTISWQDTTMVSGTYSAYPWDFITSTWSFPLSPLAPGLYYIGVIVDQFDNTLETDEFNNGIDTGLRIRVLNC
jgi:hypothetical protein